MKENNVDILLMSDNCLDTVGGEQESTKIIIKGLRDKFSIGVIQPGKVSKTELGVKYFILTNYSRLKHLIKNPFALLMYFLKARNIINKTHPLVVHTQAQVSFFVVALFIKFKLIYPDIYLIHTERGLYTKYNSLFKCIFFFCMKELKTLVTTTEFNKKHWETALKGKNIELEYKVIENTAGQLFEFFDTSLEKKTESHITIGFAGRYTSWKNWPLAVEISKKLNNILGDSLTIKMAVGCLDDKALKATYLMFNELVEIFGDRFDGKINITLEEMDKFYYNIDIFILTSNYNTESFGRTLVEAMSRKTVILTTDAGGSVEVVGDMQNVFESADECVGKIMRFINDPAMMSSEKDKNFNRVIKIYSLENNLQKHQNMYNHIIDNECVIIRE